MIAAIILINFDFYEISKYTARYTVDSSIKQQNLIF